MKLKKQLLIIAFTGAASLLYSQTALLPLSDRLPNANRHEKTMNQIIPLSHSTSEMRSGEQMLLPEEGLLYIYDHGNPYPIPLKWNYDGDNRLESYVYDNVKSIYNRTFLKKGWDILDTTYLYSDNSQTKPISRTFYDYHYYDITPIDSFYVEEIRQSWNNATQRWDNYSKDHIGYADTIGFNVRTIKLYYGLEQEWILSWETESRFLYDDCGMVTEIWDYERYNADEPLSSYARVEFFNNDDGSPHSANLYQYDADSAWECVQQRYYEWEEWYGFDSWGRGTLLGVGRRRIPISDKSNKGIVQEMWYTKHPGGLYERRYSRDEYGSNIDSTYISFDSLQTKDLVQLEANIYNRYGDYIEYKLDSWGYNEAGELIQGPYCNDVYRITYTDYGDDGIGRDVTERWEACWNPNLMQYDSTILYREKVIRYQGGIEVDIDDVDEGEPVDPRSGLSLSPNPATDRVIISAAEPIEQINLYDLTGRLLKEDYPKTQQTEFPVENLAPGAYLLKARLKSGAVKTEKMIVQ